MTIESTLASWVRTATALIGFGFGIVQFFGHLAEARTQAGQHLALYVGLVLIGSGSLATAVAVWEYRQAVKYLEGQAFQELAHIPGLRRIYPAATAAILLCLVGLLAFFTLLFGARLPWPGSP